MLIDAHSGVPPNQSTHAAINGGTMVVKPFAGKAPPAVKAHDYPTWE